METFHSSVWQATNLSGLCFFTDVLGKVAGFLRSNCCHRRWSHSCCFASWSGAVLCRSTITTLLSKRPLGSHGDCFAACGEELRLFLTHPPTTLLITGFSFTALILTGLRTEARYEQEVFAPSLNQERTNEGVERQQGLITMSVCKTYLTKDVTNHFMGLESSPKQPGLILPYMVGGTKIWSHVKF